MNIFICKFKTKTKVRTRVENNMKVIWSYEIDIYKIGGNVERERKVNKLICMIIKECDLNITNQRVGSLKGLKNYESISISL